MSDLSDAGASETVPFALDGVEYEIDLSEQEAEALREALEPYVAAGRRVGGRRSRSAASGRSNGGPETSPKVIREWARQNGYDVPARGRIPAEVREAYAAVH